MGGFFWEDFLEDFLGGILWEEFFVYIRIDLFVKILSQWRRKEGRGQEFRSSEVRRKLIALKKIEKDSDDF